VSKEVTIGATGEVAIRDDLSDLTLPQARMITALDDDPAVRPGPPRAVVVVDDTISMGEYLPERKVTLEGARRSMRAMFAGAAGLQVQVISFRGEPSKWFTDPEEAAQWIAGIKHTPGWTQHGKAFVHIIREATKQPIHAAVVFTDAVELRGPRNPDGDVLENLGKDAMRMKRLGCTVTFAYKGSIENGCPIDRAGPHAWQRIQEIAEDGNGCAFVYNPADPEADLKRFSEIATQAARAAKGDTVGAKQLLLEHHEAVPFEMTVVGEQVPSAKCER
jgi:hypothetical protein